MSRTFVHDSICFHYDVSGDGAPLVFCHGLGGDLSQPQELVGRPEGHRLVVWDARGHGQNEPEGPAGGFSFAGFAADLGALLDHLRIGQAVIGGISMGAGVATSFALSRPEVVTGLVLVRPAWLTEPMPDNLRLFPIVSEYLQRLGADGGLQEFLKLPEVQSLRRQSAYTFDSLCRQFHKPRAFERRVRLERMPNDCPVNDWDSVERSEVPTLVVGNEPDPAHPIGFAVEWARHFPNARMVQIPSKGEDPCEHALVFRRHLTSFLASLGAPAGGSGES